MNDNIRRRVYKDESPIEYLRLKEKLKINRFIKTRERSKKEREKRLSSLTTLS